MSQALSGLSRGVREEQDRGIDERVRPPIEERLAGIHAELGRRNVARGHAPYWALGAAVVAAACVLLWWGARPAAPISVARGGQPVEPGAWVQSTATAETLSFSDGTQVQLQPQTALRVLSLSAVGASLALERGTLHATVVHRDDTRWLVAAGPFEVHVTGTEFDASYDPARQVLDVQMFEGSVRVTGSCLKEPALLSDQQRASFRCQSGSAAAPEATEAKAAPSLAAPAEHATAANASAKDAPAKDTLRPAGPESAGKASETSAAAPSTTAPATEDWRALARDGHFKAALAAAEARGFAALCASESAPALLELGNAARLAGNAVRASEAYLAVRGRFGGSGAATNAAFQLGRLSFDGAGNYAVAERWFRAYLTEAPGGALAQEALGRVMECQQRTGQRSAAEQTAAQYLARFPGGAHANLARSLTPE
ncbi:MAG TPA: FecR domain-containing protein [Polyangiaceae bacterium]|nr:FecR domain-containing protein [Polyangiaceae bacterium]HMR75862.1 FecR domain-containing protein [Polyangiaceae bacterium]